jgi:hypothetical protein
LTTAWAPLSATYSVSGAAFAVSEAGPDRVRSAYAYGSEGGAENGRFVTGWVAPVGNPVPTDATVTPAFDGSADVYNWSLNMSS